MYILYIYVFHNFIHMYMYIYEKFAILIILSTNQWY
jgi:hypothetical protein